MYIIEMVTSKCVVLQTSAPIVAMRFTLRRTPAARLNM